MRGSNVVGTHCMHIVDRCMGKLELSLEVVLANIVLLPFHWSVHHRCRCSILSMVSHHVVGDHRNGYNHIVYYDMVCGFLLVLACVWSAVDGSNLVCSFGDKYHKISGGLDISLDVHPKLWLLVPSISNFGVGNNRSYHSISVSPHERISSASLGWILLCLLQIILLPVFLHWFLQCFGFLPLLCYLIYFYFIWDLHFLIEVCWVLQGVSPCWVHGHSTEYCILHQGN